MNTAKKTNSTATFLPGHIDNLAHSIIDEFEDLLDRHHINIPDPERTGSDDDAPIYGDAYTYLLEDVASILEAEFASAAKEQKQNTDLIRALYELASDAGLKGAR